MCGRVVCVIHSICFWSFKDGVSHSKNVDKCGECSEYCDSKFGLIGDGYGVSGVCGLMGDSEMWNGDDSVDECSGCDDCVWIGDREV